jgi:Flp pilus assembly protein TadB
VSTSKEGTVPLSEHEQRLLDQIEQALYAEDPKFASAVRSARRHSHARRSIMLSAFGLLAGLALVLVGLITNLIVLSVVGFVLVVGCCAFAVQVVRNRSTPAASESAGPDRKPAKPTGLRTRMEDRLRKRFDDN